MEEPSLVQLNTLNYNHGWWALNWHWRSSGGKHLGHVIEWELTTHIGGGHDSNVVTITIIGVPRRSTACWISNYDWVRSWKRQRMTEMSALGLQFFKNSHELV